MKRLSLPYVDYDSFQSGESLFAAWESGAPTQIPAPLSVRLAQYRQLIIGLVRKHHLKSCAKVLSIGAGNGFTEAELQKAGFAVLATDVSEIALEYCRRKGLQTMHYEFPDLSFPGPLDFDVIYCDGLLGHLWQSEHGYSRCWRRFAELARVDSLLILSNDLADTDEMPTLKVIGAPDAVFFRPPAGWFSHDAVASKLWRVEEIGLLSYSRRGLPRRREILTLRHSLVDEGKEEDNTSNIERSNFGFIE